MITLYIYLQNRCQNSRQWVKCCQKLHKHCLRLRKIWQEAAAGRPGNARRSRGGWGSCPARRASRRAGSSSRGRWPQASLFKHFSKIIRFFKIKCFEFFRIMLLSWFRPRSPAPTGSKKHLRNGFSNVTITPLPVASSLLKFFCDFDGRKVKRRWFKKTIVKMKHTIRERRRRLGAPTNSLAFARNVACY